MKKHLLTLLIAIFAISTLTNAQTLDSKFGVDSIKTLKNASIYYQLVKQKRYEEALESWRYVFKYAPKFQRSVYSNGVKIMRYMAKKDKKYVDTLMAVYDQRIKYFGNERKYPTAWIKGRQGSDLYKFRKNEVESLKKAYSLLMESVEGMKNRTTGSVLNTAMNASLKMFSKKQLEREIVLKNYSTFMGICDYQIKNRPKSVKTMTIVKNNIETLFLDSGVADCNLLSKMLAKKYDKVSNNMDELRDMISILKRMECTDSEIYGKIAEQMYKLEPSAKAAYNLSILFRKREEYKKTEKYIVEAISKTEVKEDKADYLVTLATLKFVNKELRLSKKYCLEALAINPKLGRAHMLIGQAYIQYREKYSKDKFEQRTIFWVAVDRFRMAKKVDPSLTEEANRAIKKYSQYYPDKGDAFFKNILPDQKYKFKGWINETTITRFSK